MIMRQMPTKVAIRNFKDPVDKNMTIICLQIQVIIHFVTTS